MFENCDVIHLHRWSLLCQNGFLTERLILRIPRIEDASKIFHAYATDPVVTKYLVWRPHSSVEVTEAFLKDRVKDWKSGVERAWVIEEATFPGLPIGMISLRPHDRFKSSMGYVLARSHWGSGFVPEAARKVISVAFDEYGLFRVASFCDSENLASTRVMEKAGMQREGLLRRYVLHPNIGPEPRDALLYAITRPPG